MSHSIAAFIGRGSELRDFTCCGPLLEDFVVVPIDAVASRNEGEQVLAPFRLLTPGVFAIVRSRVAASAAFGYIETEYFGGSGEQRAGAWRGDAVLVDPVEDPDAVNIVLRALGVRQGVGVDEWDTIDLVRYRSNDAIVAAAQRDNASC